MEARRAPGKTLMAVTARHCAALLICKPESIYRGTHGAIVDSATMTFITFEGKCYGVTNGHVLKPNGVANPVFLLALRKHEPISGRLLVWSDGTGLGIPWDVALFSFSEDKLSAAGKMPCAVLPGQSLSRNDLALAVGFPGQERFDPDERASAHAAYHVVGTCRANDPRVILQDIYEVEDQPPPAFCFGGMSGGPIFVLPNEAEPDLAGIIFEGEHRPQQTGVSAPESWIWGFPFNGQTMRALLERAA